MPTAVGGELQELTAERARAVAGPAAEIILTFTNKVRLDFAVTWAAPLIRMGLTNYLIGATDEGAFNGLRLRRLPCFSMRTNLPSAEWDWGSPSFKALGQHKVELIHKALSWGLKLVITDIDALVLREPFAYMARWPDAGFLTTSDCLGNTTGSDDGGLEDSGCYGQAFNIGYMYFNTSALPLVAHWLARVRQNPRNTWDQATFNTVARLGMGPRRAPTAAAEAGLSDRRLFRGFRGIVGGVLPVALFAGGHAHFVSRMAQRSGLRPYSVHTTFQYGGAPGKRHRLREAMLWEDPPEYYDPPGGVLTYNPQVPSSRADLAARRTPKGHVELMLLQLRQLRAALALAFALGRRLVLPPLTCTMDKYWAPLNSKGVLPGAYEWAMPLDHCPLDHLINPAEVKPRVAAHMREYSFLQNPRLDRAAFAASRNATAIDVRGGGREARRLRGMRARVLHISNVPAVADDLWREFLTVDGGGGGGGGRRARAARRAADVTAASDGAAAPPIDAPDGGDATSALLTPHEWRRFKRAFANVQGGWCCAPHGREPRAAGFHLMRAPVARHRRRR